jgi:hypothetical protein
VLHCFVDFKISDRQNVNFKISNCQNVVFKISNRQNVDIQMVVRQNVNFQITDRQNADIQTKTPLITLHISPNITFPSLKLLGYRLTPAAGTERLRGDVRTGSDEFHFVIFSTFSQSAIWVSTWERSTPAQPAAFRLFCVKGNYQGRFREMFETIFSQKIQSWSKSTTTHCNA